MQATPLFLSAAGLPRLATRSHGSRIRWACSSVQSKGTTARERRQAAERARVAAHLQLKQEIDNRRKNIENICNVYVSVPPTLRKLCGLTSRLSKVKSVVELEDVSDVSKVRVHLFSVLRNLFPELETKGLLRHDQDFDIKVRGKAVSNNDSLDDATILGDDAAASLFLEVIPHNLPALKPPLSERWENARKAASLALTNPTSQLRMVSFYKFTPFFNPKRTSEELKKLWKMLGIVGRVYVADEGINAQMGVPEETWSDFVDAMNGSWTERDRFLVPECIVGVFLNEDGSVPRSEQPFDTLHVRPRLKVLADGLPRPLDWSKAGRVLSPEEWHDSLSSDSDAIVVDCRNEYETDVGSFETAETPKTKTFRDTWGWLQNRLKDVRKDAPIMTYCTGGIRCVKVNAYLEQEMGFTNTSRLGGGIVSYARNLEEKGAIAESKFKGINHVFDGRVGKAVTDDTLSRCLNCGAPSNVQTDCAYVKCDRPFDARMFVQCPDCAAKLKGACSKECHDSIVAVGGESTCGSSLAKEGPVSELETSTPVANHERNAEYAQAFSEQESASLRAIREDTDRLFPSRSHMVSGRLQGAFLAMLVKLTGSKRVLELGTFTGYSAMCFASALPSDGVLVSCETDEEVLAVAKRHMGESMVGGNTTTVKLLQSTAWELLEEARQSTDGAPFDMVFVDANKGDYGNYYDFMLTHDIVRSGGLLVFDNVLFKSLVAKEWQNVETGRADDNIMEFSPKEQEMIRKRQRSIRKAHKIARKLHEFNEFVLRDERTEQVLLPVRDGLLVVRRK